MNQTVTAPTAASVNPEEIIELLWTRVRERGELPGFSKAISAILSAMRGDGDRDFNMTRTVLSDPVLTQKVLRLANSPMYAVFGQEINTITSAVAVLGSEAIGHLALGLKLIDGLSVASLDSRLARSEMEKAVLSGQIGCQVASIASSRDAEEARVSAMLHPLGNMMVAFYLPECWQQIQTLCREKRLPGSVAALQVLGTGLDEVGRRVARQWGLPSSLVDTFSDRHATVLSEPLDHVSWLAAVSTLSCRCADVLYDNKSDSAALPLAINRLAHDYANMLGVDGAELLSAVQQAQRLIEDAQAGIVQASNVKEPISHASATGGKPNNAAELLALGLVSLHQAEETSSTAQLLSMALEMIFQCMGFSHAMVFQRVQKEARYVARMCLGDNAADFAARLAFDDAYQPDVFHAALANDKMVFVENARDPAFINKLPRWWKEAVPTARSFLVMPLSINRMPMGFLYGDWSTTLPPSRISPEEVVGLNELRASVTRVLAQQQAQRTWGRARR